MFTPLTSTGELDEMVSLHKEDLPSPTAWEAELHQWRVLWQSTDVETQNMPGTPAEALISCNCELYPNVYAQLKIIQSQHQSVNEALVLFDG